MSAKRPRPAIPVLVHVDNPTEAASVTVDTSTIESKMNTVINNQERIYDKIPTSAGGGSADLTTVNEKITSLAETIGPISSTSSDDNIFGHVRNLQYSVGDSTKAPSLTGNSVRDLVAQIKTVVGTDNSSTAETSLIGATRNLVGAVGSYGGTLNAKGTTVRSFLYNLCQTVGDSFKAPTTTGTTVRDLLAAIKTNTASGDDLTTVNEKITAINAAVGDGAVIANNQSLIGLAKGIKASLGSMDDSDSKSNSNIKGRLYNIQSSIGDALNSPSVTGTSVRDLLAQIKAATGTTDSTSSEADLIGCVKNLRSAIGIFGTGLPINETSVRSLLYNMRTAIGSSTSTPTLTGTSIRDLLTQIKENTASGGSGGSADLTTVNEKTTALATAIGSANDDSSTVSVIGLLKSITDKY